MQYHTSMQLRALVQLTAQLRATSKKTEKTALLAGLLKEAREKEIELAALYLTGALPQGKIGIGWRTIEAAFSDHPASHLPLTLEEVDDAFGRIAVDQGRGSAERKRAALRDLFRRADRDEQRFLAHLLIGEMRQGALEGLLTEATAKAAALSLSEVRQAMMFSGNIGQVARAALEEGIAGLGRFGLRLFFPIAPMLANSADEVQEALTRLKEAAFEFKIDGGRIQVHKGGGEVKIFTRQLQEVTDRLPEIVAWARALPIGEVILEGEAIALRPDGRPHPFQITMRRFGRIKNVEAMRQEIPLSAFFFDCLYRDGDGSLTMLPYRERFEILRRMIPAQSVIPQIITGHPEEAEQFLKRSLEAGHEGLMAKSLSAPYIAGQRGNHWLKLKSAKTLDLVILAVEWGNGRRTGWLSNLHLGARDPERGKFVMLGKTFKGLTDEMLRWQTEKLLALEVKRDDWTVYVRPELVVEIAYSDIQASPRYPAGVALRFARVKRHRPDKSAAEADTVQTVTEQFKKAGGAGPGHLARGLNG
jgi:DNA ligase 1